MKSIGTVDSLWRYPVKSMAGEELEQAFVGFAGLYGDRLYAFRSAVRPAGFPYLTAREQKAMLRCRPRFRSPASAARPANLAEAESLGSGATPLYAELADLIVDVETPSGEVLAIDDPALIDLLTEGIGAGHQLTLLRSERALTDCRPLSVFSIQTARALADEANAEVDKRRFRANVYVDLGRAEGFAEDGLVGRQIRIGSKVVLSILQRDQRCKMITLDPDTGESNPKILRAVAQGHDNAAGVYAAVMVEGTICQGDAIELLG